MSVWDDSMVKIKNIAKYLNVTYLLFTPDLLSVDSGIVIIMTKSWNIDRWWWLWGKKKGLNF